MTPRSSRSSSPRIDAGVSAPPMLSLNARVENAGIDPRTTARGNSLEPMRAEEQDQPGRRSPGGTPGEPWLD